MGTQFGLKMVLSYTDDNIPKFKPVSAMNNELLIWERNSIQGQRFNVRTSVHLQEAFLTELDQLLSIGTVMCSSASL